MAWIKLEAGLLSDVRFKRLVKQVREHGNAGALPPEGVVTLCLGALAQLWLHANEHVRNDNSMRASMDDIDQIVGVENFSRFVPSDWLQVIDPDQVQLPNFLEHNGTIPKQKALAANRQARHKAKSSTNADALPSKRNGNAPPSLEQNRTEQNKNTTQLQEAAREPVGDDRAIHAEFEALKALYPPGAGRTNWLTAEHAARALVQNGRATWASLQAGIERYANLCRATNRIVMNPAKYFSDVDEPWGQPWPIPDPTIKPTASKHVPLKTAAEVEAEEAERNAEH